jgi:hypothetical protein
MAASAEAQIPITPSGPQPVFGFVSPYEIARTLRGAGFDVLAPPLREGTTYVVRATDFRGLLMRVVVDARTGAIRDATRIVPGPGRYGQLYGAPPPYDPADFDDTVPLLGDREMAPQMPSAISPLPSALPMQMAPMPSMAPASPLARAPSAAHAIPLPRRRPAALASREGAPAAGASQPQSVPPPTASTPAGPNAGGAADGLGGGAVPAPAGKPQVSTEVITAAPPTTAPGPSASGTTNTPKRPAPAGPPLND